jgi:hypothetical protein
VEDGLDVVAVQSADERVIGTSVVVPATEQLLVFQSPTLSDVFGRLLELLDSLDRGAVDSTSGDTCKDLWGA